MADLSDVENAMVDIIADSLQLGDGYLPGSAVISANTGATVRVYRGWPVENALNADLAAGISSISVFSSPGSTRNETRYLPKWHSGTEPAATVQATVSGNTVTFSGVGSQNQIVGVGFGQTTFTIRTTYNQTPESIVSALAAGLSGATANGTVLTLPTDVRVVAEVYPDIPEWLETRRQEQQIDVIGWFRDPRVRDAVMGVVDAGFANLLDQFGNLTSQFSLPDGSNAFIRYVANRTNDQAQQANLWRRDLRFRVEYPTTLSEAHPLMVFGPVNLDGGVSVVVDRSDDT